MINLRMYATGIDRVVRDAKGRYTRAQKLIHDAHGEMAWVVQREMIAVLEEEIAATGRPQRGTKFLKGALSDPGNARMLPGGRGFEVGIAEHMDRTDPVSKYWRNLEEGTHVFRERRLWMFPGRGASGILRDPLNHPNWRPQGAIPVIVRHPIRPYQYMSRGAKRGRAMLMANHGQLARAIYRHHEVIPPGSRWRGPRLGR